MLSIELKLSIKIVLKYKDMKNNWPRVNKNDFEHAYKYVNEFIIK